MKRISAVAAILLMCVMLFGGCREGGREISGISDYSERSTEFLEIGDNNSIVAKSSYSSSSSVLSSSSSVSTKSSDVSSSKSFVSSISTVSSTSSSVSSINSILSSKSTVSSISSSENSRNENQSTSSSTARISQDTPALDSPIILGITDGNSASEDITKLNSEKPVEITIPQSVSDKVTASVSSSTASVVSVTSQTTSSEYSEPVSVAESSSIETEPPVVSSSESTLSSETSSETKISPKDYTGDVYIASSGKGKKFHISPNCSGMKGTVAMTVSEAEEKGYTPCKKCWEI